MANLKVKVSEIPEKLQVLPESIENTILEHPHMSKVSSRCVPQNLSVHNRHQCVASRRELN